VKLPACQTGGKKNLPKARWRCIIDQAVARGKGIKIGLRHTFAQDELIEPVPKRGSEGVEVWNSFNRFRISKILFSKVR
jgi:hypothetical protein